ncbi:MAG: nucleoside transporter C-terminal domain-containing protein [Bdellovibrionales bacterium]
MQERFTSILGIAVIIGISYLFSNNRRAIRWKSVGLGLLLQIVFIIAILGIPSLHIPGVFRFIFDGLNSLVTNLVDFTNSGARFVFGPLADIKEPWGFIFAFRALPTIIFFSALMSGLYHLGILQKVVRAVAFVMQKTLNTSGAETLSAAANIFIGQTEAPLMIKPFIAKMTPSEIYCVMVGGMATIAAGVEGAYIGLLRDRVPDIGGHLLTASTLGAVGGLIISKIIFPETGEPVTQGKIDTTPVAKTDGNFLEAVARGASDGVMLALNVAAMLIAFIAIISILDAVIGKLGVWAQLSDQLSFAYIMGKICQPFAWLIGVPWSETVQVGRLIGEKIVMNEFVAYVHLADVGKLLSDRTVLITSYALCGFANFSSIGIQIGGIGGMAPAQKTNIARLGLLAVLGGNLACLLSACIVGLLF